MYNDAAVSFTAYAGHDNYTYTVSSQDELNAAVTQAAQTGGTIYVDGTGGPYSLYMNGIGSEGTPILIESQDAAHPATFTQISLYDSNYVTLNDLHVEAGDLSFTRQDFLTDIYVKGCDHIEITNTSMLGMASGEVGVDPNAVQGDDAVMFRESTNVTFTGNTISHYNNGINLLDVNGGQVDNNEITAMQADGIHGGGMQNLSLSNNYIHDFLGSTVDTIHSDAIQVWTAYPTDVPNANLTISGNLLDAGEGTAFQGVLVQNDSFNTVGHPLAGTYLQNVSITDNVIYTGTYTGIAVTYTEGLVVDNNTVLWDQNSYLSQHSDSIPENHQPWILVRWSPGAVADHNIAQSVSVNDVYEHQTNYALDYVNQDSDHYAFTHFVGLSESHGLSLYDMQLTPDSPLNGIYGAPATSFAAGHDLTLAIDKMVDPGNGMAVDLSAEYSSVNGTLIDPATSHVTWTFSDGTVAEGMNVVHAFDTSGDKTVTMQVTTADGQTATLQRDFAIHSNTLFQTDFSNGGADESEWHTDVIANDPHGTAWTTGLSGEGFRLDGASTFTLSRDATQLDQHNTMSVHFDFNQDNMTAGELMSVQTGMDLWVKDDGSLKLDLYTDQGTYHLVTDANALTPGQWQGIAVDYDGPAGNLSLSIDGKELASTQATGMIGGQNYPVWFGNPWGSSAEGVIDNVSITAPPSAVFSETDHTAADPTLTDPAATDPTATDPTVTDPLVDHTATDPATTTDTTTTTTTTDAGSGKLAPASTTTHSSDSGGPLHKLLVEIAKILGISWKDVTDTQVADHQTTTTSAAMTQHETTTLHDMFPEAGIIDDTAVFHEDDHTGIDTGIDIAA